MSDLKFLLISPGKLKTIAQTSNSMTLTMATFPVGLAYVSASMKHAGYNVTTLNSNFINSDFDSTLKNLIIKNSINVVCTGGTSYDVHELNHILKITKQTNSRITTIVGGAIISSDPETAMKVLDADIGVIGEGEETMCELAGTLNNKTYLNNVSGIIYKYNGGLKQNRNRPEIKDINLLPLMDFEGFSYNEWLKTTNFSGIIHSARSCPYQCTFCYKSTGNKYRQRTLDSVFNEIDYQIENFNIKSIMISDELFATNRKRIIDFCDRVKAYNFSWSSSLRVREIDIGLLHLMKDAGCRGIGTGLESGDYEILKSMRKNVTVEELKNALDIFVESKIGMLGNFIFGDKSETQISIDTTLDLWKKYNQKIYINLGIVATLPGTQIYYEACNKGIIKNKEQFLKDCSFIINITEMDNSEYYDMISLITEMGFKTQVPAKQVKIEGVDKNGFCKIKWQCRSCDQKHTLTETHFLQAPILTCSCGIQNTVEPLRYVSCDKKILLNELPDNELIAFWGVGSQYYRLETFCHCLTSNNFIQVDANTYQQKMTRFGKKIHDPKIIKKKNITSVVITSPIAKNVILKTINDEYSNVTTVYFPKLIISNQNYITSFQAITSP